MAFTTKNVKSEVDLEKRTAEFKANCGGSYVSFPINQYICYIDQFKWFMDKKLIELGSLDKNTTNLILKNLNSYPFTRNRIHFDLHPLLLVTA